MIQTESPAKNAEDSRVQNKCPRPLFLLFWIRESKTNESSWALFLFFLRDIIMSTIKTALQIQTTLSSIEAATSPTTEEYVSSSEEKVKGEDTDRAVTGVGSLVLYSVAIFAFLSAGELELGLLCFVLYVGWWMHDLFCALLFVFFWLVGRSFSGSSKYTRSGHVHYSVCTRRFFLHDNVGLGSGGYCSKTYFNQIGNLSSSTKRSTSGACEFFQNLLSMVDGLSMFRLVPIHSTQIPLLLSTY